MKTASYILLNLKKTRKLRFFFSSQAQRYCEGMADEPYSMETPGRLQQTVWCAESYVGIECAGDIVK